jgi:subtilisin family serine protease
MNFRRAVSFFAGSVLIAFAGLAGAADTVELAGDYLLLKDARSSSDIYIVQLKGDPIIAYQGEIKSYKATKPGKGENLNPNSAHVKKYGAYLESRQDDAIASVGGDKVYSYRYSFNGFAARMSAADAAALRSDSNVINVWKDELRQIQTDASPTYIGITEGGQAWSKGLTGEDVVIGIVDTGVWPEHPSFADVPTPKKGNKGPNIPYGDMPAGFTPSGCDFGNPAVAGDEPFSCNNKLVTARCYNRGVSAGPDPTNPCGGDAAFSPGGDFQSARDANGHGSHTASTAGGNNGVPASIGGDFLGLVSGIAPRARIAAYKVCWNGEGCASSDSMAAIDQAVADGVDVINFSIGGGSTSFASPDDIAFLFAADAAVFVATSNGNSGPGAQTTGTPAGVPWITAVGATQDSGVFYSTITINAPANVAGEIVSVEGAGDVSLASVGTITDDVTLVSDLFACGPVAPISGIALASRGGCSFSSKYNNAAAAGADAIIVYNDGANSSRIDPIVMSAPGTSIPGFMISFTEGNALANETGLHATMDPSSSIVADNRIAGFSSRGPNGGAMDVIKPDVSAPGVAILAAASPAAGGELFMSINGTSMASPHVAGTFALLKQAHPDWSAAQARSAVMTTARQDLNKTFGDAAADPFDIGAGEVVPSDASDPGLSYDAGFFDYLAFSCDNNVQLISDGNCAALAGFGFPTDGSDLNHASMGIADLVGSQTITRTVTSVANNNGNKSFTASVDAPPGIDVSVSPSTIKLRSGESATFEVTFTVTGAATLDDWAFGSLTWTHGSEYSVRSPIAVKPSAFSAPASVNGSGTDGTLSYDVAFGYNGGFEVSMDGITEGEGQPDVVADGGNTLHFFFVPPGTTLARFSLFDSEIGAQNDLDLQIQGPDSAGYPFVCFSGSGSSEEQCDLPNPAPGFYAAFVIDFASDAGPTSYTLWNFNMAGTQSGSTTVTAPPSAVLGTNGQIDVSWSGLNPGTRALGLVNYGDGVNPLGGQTAVMINTQ